MQKNCQRGVVKLDFPKTLKFENFVRQQKNFLKKVLVGKKQMI